MSSVTLKLCMDNGSVSKKVNFDPKCQIYEVYKIIEDKVLTGAAGENYGLFLPNVGDEKSGIWLEPEKTLEYYLLRDGDTLHYVNKIRKLRLRMLDGSVKTLKVDDSQIVSSLMVQICARIGITNHDEYALCREDAEMQVQEEEKMTLKRKHQGQGTLERDAKMEQLKKKLKTDDDVQWVNPKKTLREQCIEPSETLLLKRRLFYSDRNVDSRDPVQLGLLYVQARDAILDGTHPVTQAKAVEFAGIQCQIQFGDYDSKKHTAQLIDSSLKDLIPEHYISERGVRRSVQKHHESLQGLQELDAKLLYIKTARSLNTYGVTFFLVKEKQKGKNKLVLRLLGINSESVLRVDETTREVLEIWPLSHVKRWAPTTTTFTLDFGEYSKSLYTVQTTEALRIMDVLTGYIDIILKRQQGRDYHGRILEGGEMYEESVFASSANTISNVGGGATKVQTEFFVGPSKMIENDDEQMSSEGRQIITTHHQTVKDYTKQHDVKRMKLDSSSSSGDPQLRQVTLPKLLNIISASSQGVISMATGDRKLSIDDLEDEMKILNDKIPQLKKGLDEKLNNLDDKAKKPFLLHYDNICDGTKQMVTVLNAKQPYNLGEIQGCAGKVLDASTQLYFLLDPDTNRRSRLLLASRKSFMEDDVASDKRMSEVMLTVIDDICQNITKSEKEFGTDDGKPILSLHHLRDLKNDAAGKLARCNAAAAVLLASHVDPKDVDYPAAVTALNTMAELMARIIADIKLICKVLPEEERAKVLTDVHELCRATKGLCESPKSQNPEKINESAQNFAKASGKVFYAISPTTDPNLENELVRLAKVVGGKTSDLLLTSKKVADLTSPDHAAAIEDAGISCYSSATRLITCAQLTAPSIYEPHCQSAILTASECVGSTVASLSDVLKPERFSLNTLSPADQQALGKEIEHDTIQVEKALDELKSACGAKKPGCNILVQHHHETVETLPPELEEDDLMQDILSSAGHDAGKGLNWDKIVGQEARNPLISEDEAKTAKDSINKRIAISNSGAANFLLAHSDPKSIDYVAALDCIDTLNNNVPYIVKDVHALSHVNDDELRSLLSSTRDMYKAAPKKLNSAVLTFGDHTAKILHAVCEPNDAHSKQIMNSANMIDCKVSNFLEHAEKVSDSVEDPQLKDYIKKAVQHCSDVNKIFNTCAKVTSPTITTPICQDSLHTATDNLKRAINNVLLLLPQNSSCNAESSEIRNLLTGLQSENAKNAALNLMTEHENRSDEATAEDMQKLRDAVKALDKAESKVKTHPNDISSQDELKQAMDNLQSLLKFLQSQKTAPKLHITFAHSNDAGIIEERTKNILQENTPETVAIITRNLLHDLQKLPAQQKSPEVRSKLDILAKKLADAAKALECAQRNAQDLPNDENVKRDLELAKQNVQIIVQDLQTFVYGTDAPKVTVDIHHDDNSHKPNDIGSEPNLKVINEEIQTKEFESIPLTPILENDFDYDSLFAHLGESTGSYDTQINLNQALSPNSAQLLVLSCGNVKRENDPKTLGNNTKLLISDLEKIAKTEPSSNSRRILQQLALKLAEASKALQDAEQKAKQKPEDVSAQNEVQKAISDVHNIIDRIHYGNSQTIANIPEETTEFMDTCTLSHTVTPQHAVEHASKNYSNKPMSEKERNIQTSLDLISAEKNDSLKYMKPTSIQIQMGPHMAGTIEKILRGAEPLTTVGLVDLLVEDLRGQERNQECLAARDFLRQYLTRLAESARDLEVAERLARDTQYNKQSEQQLEACQENVIKIVRELEPRSGSKPRTLRRACSIIQLPPLNSQSLLVACDALAGETQVKSLKDGFRVLLNDLELLMKNQTDPETKNNLKQYIKQIDEASHDLEIADRNHKTKPDKNSEKKLQDSTKKLRDIIKQLRNSITLSANNGDKTKVDTTTNKNTAPAPKIKPKPLKKTVAETTLSTKTETKNNELTQAKRNSTVIEVELLNAEQLINHLNDLLNNNESKLIKRSCDCVVKEIQNQAKLQTTSKAQKYLEDYANKLANAKNEIDEGKERPEDVKRTEKAVESLKSIAKDFHTSIVNTGTPAETKQIGETHHKPNATIIEVKLLNAEQLIDHLNDLLINTDAKLVKNSCDFVVKEIQKQAVLQKTPEARKYLEDYAHKLGNAESNIEEGNGRPKGVRETDKALQALKAVAREFQTSIIGIPQTTNNMDDQFLDMINLIDGIKETEELNTPKMIQYVNDLVKDIDKMSSKETSEEKRKKLEGCVQKLTDALKVFLKSQHDAQSNPQNKPKVDKALRTLWNVTTEVQKEIFPKKPNEISLTLYNAQKLIDNVNTLLKDKDCNVKLVMDDVIADVKKQAESQKSLEGQRFLKEYANKMDDSLSKFDVLKGYSPESAREAVTDIVEQFNREVITSLGSLQATTISQLQTTLDDFITCQQPRQLVTDVAHIIQQAQSISGTQDSPKRRATLDELSQKLREAASALQDALRHADIQPKDENRQAAVQMATKNLRTIARKMQTAIAQDMTGQTKDIRITLHNAQNLIQSVNRVLHSGHADKVQCRDIVTEIQKQAKFQTSTPAREYLEKYAQKLTQACNDLDMVEKNAPGKPKGLTIEAARQVVTDTVDQFNREVITPLGSPEAITISRLQTTLDDLITCEQPRQLDTDIDQLIQQVQSISGAQQSPKRRATLDELSGRLRDAASVLQDALRHANNQPKDENRQAAVQMATKNLRTIAREMQTAIAQDMTGQTEDIRITLHNAQNLKQSVNRVLHSGHADKVQCRDIVTEIQKEAKLQTSTPAREYLEKYAQKLTQAYNDLDMVEKNATGKPKGLTIESARQAVTDTVDQFSREVITPLGLPEAITMSQLQTTLGDLITCEQPRQLVTDIDQLIQQVQSISGAQQSPKRRATLDELSRKLRDAASVLQDALRHANNQPKDENRQAAVQMATKNLRTIAREMQTAIAQDMTGQTEDIRITLHNAQNLKQSVNRVLHSGHADKVQCRDIVTEIQKEAKLQTSTPAREYLEKYAQKLTQACNDLDMVEKNAPGKPKGLTIEAARQVVTDIVEQFNREVITSLGSPEAITMSQLQTTLDNLITCQQPRQLVTDIDQLIEQVQSISGAQQSPKRLTTLDELSRRLRDAASALRDALRHADTQPKDEKLHAAVQLATENLTTIAREMQTAIAQDMTGQTEDIQITLHNAQDLIQTVNRVIHSEHADKVQCRDIVTEIQKQAKLQTSKPANQFLEEYARKIKQAVDDFEISELSAVGKPKNSTQQDTVKIQRKAIHGLLGSFKTEVIQPLSVSLPTLDLLSALSCPEPDKKRSYVANLVEDIKRNIVEEKSPSKRSKLSDYAARLAAAAKLLEDVEKETRIHPKNASIRKKLSEAIQNLNNIIISLHEEITSCGDNIEPVDLMCNVQETRVKDLADKLFNDEKTVDGNRKTVEPHQLKSLYDSVDTIDKIYNTLFVNDKKHPSDNTKEVLKWFTHDSQSEIATHVHCLSHSHNDNKEISNLNTAVCSFAHYLRDYSNYFDAAERTRLATTFKRVLYLIKLLILNRVNNNSNKDKVHIILMNEFLKNLDNLPSSAESNETLHNVNKLCQNVLMANENKNIVLGTSSDLQQRLFCDSNKLKDHLSQLSSSKTIDGLQKEFTIIYELYVNIYTIVRKIIMGEASESTILYDLNKLTIATYCLMRNAVFIVQNKNNSECRRIMYDSCMTFNESIHTILTTTTKTAPLQQHCLKVTRNIPLLQTMLHEPCEIGTQTYQTCNEGILAQRAVFDNFRTDGVCEMSNFSDIVKDDSLAVTKCVDLVTKCRYLLTTSESKQSIEFTDTYKLLKSIKLVQASCLALQYASYDREVGDNASEVTSELTNLLCETCERLGRNQTLDVAVRQSWSQVASQVADATEQLGLVIDGNQINRKEVSSVGEKLLVAVTKLLPLVQDTHCTAAPISENTQLLCGKLDEAVSEFMDKYVILMKQVESHGFGRQISYKIFKTNREEFVSRYEVLVKVVRENGEKAGLLEILEDNPKNYLDTQIDLAKKWLLKPNFVKNKKTGQEAVTNFISIAEKVSKELKCQEKSDIIRVINDTKKLYEECCQNSDTDKCRHLLDKVLELKRCVERVVVSKVVDNFIHDHNSLEDIKFVVLYETDASKSYATLEQKIKALLAQLSMMTSIARAVHSTTPGHPKLLEQAEKAELLAPKLVQAAKVKLEFPHNQIAEEKFHETCIEYSETITCVRDLCDQAVDPLHFVRLAGETIHKLCEDNKRSSDVQQTTVTKSCITRLANRVMLVGMSESKKTSDPELESALKSAQDSLAAAIPRPDARASTLPDWTLTTQQILKGAGEVESALGGETIFTTQPEPDQPIYMAAHALHSCVSEWSATDNDIVEAARRVAVLMARLNGYMNTDKKDYSIRTSKQIVEASGEVARLARILSAECTDIRIRNNLLQVCDQIPTISGQLKMLASVKANKPAQNCNSTEDKEAMIMLVDNAQNLMHSVQEVVKAAAAASVKIQSDRGVARMRWVRARRY